MANDIMTKTELAAIVAGEQQRALITPLVLVRQGQRNGERRIPFVAATEGTKRDGNAIVTAGWELDNYRKTGAPVLWCHDTRSPAIGVAPDMRTQGKQLVCTVEFARAEDYAFADTIYKLYSAQPPIMRGGSVQWRPLEFEPNLDETGRQTGWRFTRQELLEFSLCPVPADPDAIARAIQSRLVTAEELEKFVRRVSLEKTRPIEVRINVDVPASDTTTEAASPEANAPHAQAAHGQHETAGPPSEEASRSVVSATGQSDWPKVDEGAAWDAARAERDIRKHASADGSGAKDTMDWVEYRKGFAWFDGNDAENFRAYKLPHHVYDGGWKQHWRGSVAAMAALLGSRGGVTIPASDRRGVYNHLSVHYRSFDKQPPEFRLFEDLDEFERALTDGTWTADPDTVEALRSVLGSEPRPAQSKKAGTGETETRATHDRGELADAIESDEDFKFSMALRSCYHAVDKTLALVLGMTPGEEQNAARVVALASELGEVVLPHLLVLAESPVKSRHAKGGEQCQGLLQHVVGGTILNQNTLPPQGKRGRSESPTSNSPEVPSMPSALARLRALTKQHEEEQARALIARLEKLTAEWHPTSTSETQTPSLSDAYFTRAGEAHARLQRMVRRRGE